MNLKSFFEITSFEMKTLIWWINRRNQIDMNPPYQRKGRLWSESDKAFLIDTILNGFDIPKFYMADFTWGNSILNKKKLSYAIIDGKQRFEAIFDFYDGKIKLNKDFRFLKDESIKISGYTYKDLSEKYPEIAEIFDNCNLSIMRVRSEEEEFINDLFVRLNRSKPLTGAEIRNAMSGPAVDLIRQISKHEFFTSYINFSTARGTDQDISAKILMFEYIGKLATTKKNNLDEFVEDSNDKTRLELSGRKVIEVLTIMTTVFLPKDTLLKMPGIIPVYYWFIKDIDENKISFLRDFLISIEEERKYVSSALKKGLNNDILDQEFIKFNDYYRYPNDASSYEARYDFLQRKFPNYLPINWD